MLTLPLDDEALAVIGEQNAGHVMADRYLHVRTGFVIVFDDDDVIEVLLLHLEQSFHFEFISFMNINYCAFFLILCLKFIADDIACALILKVVKHMNLVCLEHFNCEEALQLLLFILLFDIIFLYKLVLLVRLDEILVNLLAELGA